MNKNIVRITSGIETSKYGCEELLKALMNEKIINSPEAIRLGIEGYFKNIDLILEQAKILHDLSAENKDIKADSIKEIVRYIKGAYERGVDVGFLTIDFIAPIIEKEIFKKEKAKKTIKQIEKEKFEAELNLEKYEPEKPEKEEKLIPSVIKKNIQLKHDLTNDLFFILNFLNQKEKEIDTITYEIKIQQGQTDSKKSTSEINNGGGYAERFAKGN